MTNPSPPPDEFEVAKVVSEKLKTLPADRQERVLRWVAESLGVSLPPRDSPPPQRGYIEAPRPIERATDSPRDIKSFVAEKNPSSDQQFATVVAYYYQFEAPPSQRRRTIDGKVLQEATRLAGRKRVAKPIATLNNAKAQGYLDSVGRGEFGINSVGENLVAMALPGSGKDSAGARRTPGKRTSQTEARARRR